ncbi:hypothetical protein NAEGRDRAFT_78464 [Naegleria gruberi]|uniref:Uncharacterized protein n=1 Tax=Naegleria gruberi TaxID=5762 RepID=D2V3Y9_NAEGR|nr:uncharacterized protein NAEGRDRAFT_78464 [Naegleria gruberi]EFC48432.1 hypothetical protein NAEGRDRAFT_78464 [Naegleria gruberi]|eukprot:XP_002681176.1 hypothetical protein NAEGRDRAFT_78464 [Naegleria gruberi strain NEG-M]
MNNSEAHQPLNSEQLDETTTRTTTAPQEQETTRTPLYDMFSKNIEHFIDSIQKKQYTNQASAVQWQNLANMFSFQLLLIGLVLIFSVFWIGTPLWIAMLVIIGIGCGFYSMATKDPLGMFIYSLLNFIGLVICTRYLDFGYAAIGMFFILLLLNQIKSIRYVIEFGRAKLGKRQVFENDSNV